MDIYCGAYISIYLYRYYEDLLKPLVDIGEDGVQMQIGHGGNSVSVIAHIRIVCICGDNEGLDKLSLCASGRTEGFLCRICMCPDVKEGAWGGFAKKNLPWQRKDNDEIRKLIKQNKDIKRDTFQRSLSNRSGSQSQPRREIDKQTLRRARELALRPGCNAFMDLPPHIRPAGGLPAMVGPDAMHTYNGGTIKACLECSLRIIYALQNINPKEYGKLMSTLDVMVEFFPRKHSVIPFKLPHMKHGISQFLPERRDTKKKQDQSYGLSVGHIPLEDLPGMLWQVVYCCNELLPENSSDFGDRREGPRWNWPIRKQVYNAAHSALDVIAILKSTEGYSDKDVEEFEHALRVSNAHLFLLFALKKDLIDVIKEVPISKRTPHKSIMRKPHAALHIPEFIEQFGDPAVFNTMAGRTLSS